MTKFDIAGLKVDSITKKELIDGIISRIKNGQKTFVITPYSEFLYHGFQDPKLLEIFNQADFSVADGIGLFWAKRFLDIPLTAKSYWGKVFQSAWQIAYSLAAIIFNPRWIKSALPEKIVGADLIWDLAEIAAKNNLSIFLLGGFNDTAQKTALQLNIYASKKCGRILNQQWSNKNPDDLSVIEDINKSNSDILFVAYGPTRQEKWIAENLPKLNVKLAIGLGGTFDYIAGKKSTPPEFIRYSGLEWLWRLITQPYRAKRIFHATFGLASGLWHYKVFMSLPYRPNAISIILNAQNELLVALRNPHDKDLKDIGDLDTVKFQNYWQFSQGGIERGENLEGSARREIFEELGIKNLKFLFISNRTSNYVWKNALRPFFNIYHYKGQEQQILYFKFTGGESEIKVDNQEFIQYKWVDLWDLNKIVHPEKFNIVKIVQEDLKNLL
jgi:N-acetylglucosaminyldiphosphoundecaprenol N-acetyl-beta-D-mannosaminyltransferase